MKDREDTLDRLRVLNQLHPGFPKSAADVYNAITISPSGARSRLKDLWFLQLVNRDRLGQRYLQWWPTDLGMSVKALPPDKAEAYLRRLALPYDNLQAIRAQAMAPIKEAWDLHVYAEMQKTLV